MPRRTSVADAQPLRFVLVTMDRHLAGAAERARQQVCRELPNLEFTQHAVCDWNENPAALARCVEDIGKADLIVVTMLFMEEHYLPVIDALRTRRPHCAATSRGSPVSGVSTCRAKAAARWPS